MGQRFLLGDRNTQAKLLLKVKLPCDTLDSLLRCVTAQAYTMAPKAEKIRVLRVLCREDFSMQSAESFVDDLKQAMTWLDGHFIYTPQQLKALQMSMKWQGVAHRFIKVQPLLGLEAGLG